MLLEKTVAENAWQVEDGLYRILLPLSWAVPFVNVFVLESQGQYALVDCGMNWETSLRALGRALKAIGVPAGGLKYLILTHRHPDHAGAAAAIAQRWGGKVLIHPLDQHYDYPTPQAVLDWLRANGMEASLAAQVAAQTGEPPDPLPPASPLPLTEPLVLGNLRFDVIHAPGHCRGQVMLQEPRRGWLLTADQALVGPAPNVWLHPGEQHNPLADYLRSLEATVQLNPRLFLPSHGMPMLGGMPGTAAAMADFHRGFVQTVQGLLRARHRTPWELTKLVRGTTTVDPNEARFALAAIMAVLRYLESRQEARRGPDGLWESLRTHEAVS